MHPSTSSLSPHFAGSSAFISFANWSQHVVSRHHCCLDSTGGFFFAAASLPNVLQLPASKHHPAESKCQRSSVIVTFSNFCCNKQILHSFGLCLLNGGSVAHQKEAHKSFSIQRQSRLRVKGSLNVVGPCRENQQGWTSQAKKRLYC